MIAGGEPTLCRERGGGSGGGGKRLDAGGLPKSGREVNPKIDTYIEKRARVKGESKGK